MLSAVMPFIARWQASEASERANYSLFLAELCDFLEVPRPEPTGPNEHRNTYVFEKAVVFQNLDGTVSQGRIDLYKRAHFVLEAKQGSNPPVLQIDNGNNLILSSPTSRPARARRGTAMRGTHGWDEAMLAARYQAEQYAKALPASEGWPPFLVTVDVGHSIELYADFSLTGKAYLPFPDPRSYRILFTDFALPANRDRLRALWLDPHSLDPARHTARVTRRIAAKLATLARNLEQTFPARDVAEFLTRCIFTSFAEDVKLLPDKSWLRFLEGFRDREDIAVFPEMASSLWQTMNAGGFSPIVRSHVLRFNGGLFQSTAALPLTYAQLGLLIDAADSNWRDVEPAIFGTLLERALDPEERHSLGAHYTPRAYVERLVIPTLVEPLRADWANVQAAIANLVHTGDTTQAIETTRIFHRRLCETRVLDPACGSGNFLYVALEHLKRLEGEVLETLVQLGETQAALEYTGLTVDPHQLLGIERNPRAAVIADLVLWIGYLQWHFRTRGEIQPPAPVIGNFHNIEHRDALMSWSREVSVLDEGGKPVTQWDGKTKRLSLVTGSEVPDETARCAVFHLEGVKQAPWPEADFIVGNPPFIGGKDIRAELSDGYVEALRALYTDVPDSADYVMFWWQRAAELARSGAIRRFGFITTNSLPQVFNRKVVAQNLSASKNPLSLVFAIPDHPWMKAVSVEDDAAARDGAKAAAVRIAMTVAERGEREGHLYRVTKEGNTRSEGTLVELSEQTGKIFADLQIDADVTSASPLRSNEDLSCRGVSLHGAGFIVTPEEAAHLGLGRIPGLDLHIRPYLNGRDLTGTSRNKRVIDLFGLSSEHVRLRFPEVYQWVYDRVKPERDENRRATYAQNWWTFGEPRANFRPALRGLPRYIATVETAKHRIFVFLDAAVLPDNKLVNIALSDAYYLGVLSSKAHVFWSLNAGSTLEDRPVYVKTRCFDPFPFPDCTESQQQTIRNLAEQLDAHRKRQQQLHPTLTLTALYNTLEKLRAGAAFTEDDHAQYNAGLIGILRELHDDLDRAVFVAYGWPEDPQTLPTEELLTRIVALNAVRRAEEASGLIRWLRPEYQAPSQAAQVIPGTLAAAAEPAAATRRKQPWPETLPEQVKAIKEALRATPLQTSNQVAAGFRPASRIRVAEILATLTALGQTRESTGRFSL